jgi:hypothetical protein
MSRTPRAPKANPDRAALRRRVLARIRALNAGDTDVAFEMIDPKLRAKGTPQSATHAEKLLAFRAVYGEIEPWHVRINFYPDGTTNKHDPRPFAYVYLVWKDAAKEFHLFRDRWVKDGGQWFTRVVGLVPAKAAGTV